MFRSAILASIIHLARRLPVAAKGIRMSPGRGRPTRLATLDDRVLRDIGLSRHDLWDGTPEPLCPSPASLAAPLRLSCAGPGRYERRSGRILARLWAEESRHA